MHAGYGSLFTKACNPPKKDRNVIEYVPQSMIFLNMV